MYICVLIFFLNSQKQQQNDKRTKKHKFIFQPIKGLVF
jgi:hypothetical protein